MLNRNIQQKNQHLSVNKYSRRSATKQINTTNDYSGDAINLNRNKTIVLFKLAVAKEKYESISI